MKRFQQILDFLLARVSSRHLVAFISLALLLVPLLFWGHLYSVGGDDSRLYYLYPEQYLRNFSSTIISTNQLGSLGYYFPQSYTAGFVAVIYLLKHLFFFLNVQTLMLGLNLAVGFVAFYALLGQVTEKRDRLSDAGRITAALFYVLCSVTFYTVWLNQLFAVYLLSVFPAVLYLFIRAVREARFSLAVAAMLLISVFSVLLLSVPWLLALVLSSLPLLATAWRDSPKRFFQYAVGSGVLLVLFNAYWILHLVLSLHGSGGESGNLVASIATQSFRSDNASTIQSVSQSNQLTYPLFGFFHQGVQADFTWSSYGTFLRQARFLPLNIGILLLVLAPLALLRRLGAKERGAYLGSFGMWLLMVFLFTVNIGGWGEPLFLWLNNTVPGFVMFRNMYDKFSLSFAFSYALLLGISLPIVLRHAPWQALLVPRKVVQSVGIVALVLVIGLGSASFALGKFYNEKLWTTNSTYMTVSSLNSDYLDLASYVASLHEPSRFLWLPMSAANYVAIQDAGQASHYYVGVSPLRFLAGATDFDGKLSFSGEQGAAVSDALDAQDYVTLARHLQQLNVRYVIVNHNLSDEVANSYLYGQSILDNQGDGLYKELLGAKVRDFGSRYSLYEVNPAYATSSVYLANDLKAIPATPGLSFVKKSDEKYEVTLTNLSAGKNLVFLDPYQGQWGLYTRSGQSLSGPSHVQAFSYANAWTISADELRDHAAKDQYSVNPDGSVNAVVDIMFKPVSLSLPGQLLSAISALVSLMYLVAIGARGVRTRRGRV